MMTSPFGAPVIADALRTYVLQDAPILMLLLDAGLVVVDVNHPARRLLAGDVIGRPLANQFVDFHRTLDLPELIRQGDQVHRLTVQTANGQPETLDFRFFALPEGTLVFASLDVQEQRKLEDEVLGLNRELNDLTRQLHLANAELRDLATQAVAANHAKSQFLSAMSHEIRTPLNGVIGMTDMLGKTGLTSEQEMMVKIIKDCGSSLLSVIGDVLDLAKIESGKVEIDRQVCDLRRLVEELRGMFVATALTKGHTLLFRVASEVPQHVLVDAGRLRQVLINLVGNAANFTDHGEVGLSASIDTSGPDRLLVRWEVSDTGPGIPADFLPRVFTPFSQANTSMTRHHRGIGLGLAISKQFVDLMGGDLTVTSTPGHGSQFRFVIPVGPCPTESAVPAEEAERAILPAWSRPPSVLVVEDDAASQFALDLMLTELGCPHELAENGNRAIAAVTAGSYDLVLMDCQMPECDGVTATRVIREREPAGSRRLPIIALTAGVFTEDRERCRKAGMDDFLAKPCSLEALKACLVKWAGETESGTKA